MQEFSQKDFAEKLKTVRKTKFHTQEQISAVLGIKRVTYARYETTTLPPYPVLYKICQILDISADYLLKPIEIIEPDEAENAVES